MTGITKDELMQIMKEAMALEVRSPHVFSDGSLNRAAYVANAILERAAVELDADREKLKTNSQTDFVEAQAAWHSWVQATEHAATKIRALKINTGD